MALRKIWFHTERNCFSSSSLQAEEVLYLLCCFLSVQQKGFYKIWHKKLMIISYGKQSDSFSDWAKWLGRGRREWGQSSDLCHWLEKNFTLLTKVKSAFFYRAALSITIIKSLNHVVAYGYFCTVLRIKVTLMSWNASNSMPNVM